MEPEKIDLPKHRIGDRWPAGGDENTVYKIGPITFNGIVPLNNLSRVEMRFGLDAETYVIDSDAGQDHQCTITDAATWEVEIPVTQSFLSTCGFWRWDMAFYDSVNTAPITLFYGLQEVTSQV